MPFWISWTIPLTFRNCSMQWDELVRILQMLKFKIYSIILIMAVELLILRLAHDTGEKILTWKKEGVQKNIFPRSYYTTRSPKSNYNKKNILAYSKILAKWAIFVYCSKLFIIKLPCCDDREGSRNLSWNISSRIFLL